MKNVLLVLPKAFLFIVYQHFQLTSYKLLIAAIFQRYIVLLIEFQIEICHISMIPHGLLRTYVSLSIHAICPNRDRPEGSIKFDEDHEACLSQFL